MRTRFYSAILLLASLVTLAFAVAAGLEENYFREWRTHQREYAKLTAGEKPFEQGLKQYYLPELNRIDRCTSCHMGVFNTDMAKAEQPLTTHPGEYLFDHQPQEYGCTLCHAGQGLATNSLEAHANDPHEKVFWDEPVYSSTYVQASCRTCHASSWLADNGAPVLSKGAELFTNLGCNSCHKTGGLGGSRGPALDGIGSQPHGHFSMAHLEEPHTVEHWQEAHLRDPQAVVEGSAMRNYGLSDEDVTALGVYLMSLRDIRVPEKMIHSRDSLDRDNPNGQIIYQRYCSGCHDAGMEDRKDSVLNWRVPAIRNPAFTAVAGAEFIRNTINHGRPGTPMESMGSTSSGLSSREIDALVAYIMEGADEVEVEPWTFVDEDDEVDVDEGRDLYNDSCKMCHGEFGEGSKDGLSLTAPTLAAMPDEFFLITVRDGREGTSMNSAREELEFEDYEIASVVAYIRKLQEQTNKKTAAR